MILHIKEAKWTPSRINPEISTQRYMITKLSKDKESILKATRGKTDNQFLMRNVRAGGSGMACLKCWMKDCQPRSPCPTNVGRKD